MVHFPSKEVTDGAEILNCVAGGELGRGGVEEEAMIADGEEVVNSDDE